MVRILPLLSGLLSGGRQSSDERIFRHRCFSRFTIEEENATVAKNPCACSLFVHPEPEGKGSLLGLQLVFSSIVKTLSQCFIPWFIQAP